MEVKPKLIPLKVNDVLQSLTLEHTELIWTRTNLEEGDVSILELSWVDVLTNHGQAV